MIRSTTNRHRVRGAVFLLVGLGLALAAGAEPEEPENVRITLLRPAEAAPGLRVFRHQGDRPMDRAKMGALMNRALDDLKSPDGVIASASGSRIRVDFASEGTASLEYDEASHSWSGQVLVVVLPQ